jgi:competence ComEA-like helix-hairpin-helix protein
VESAPQQPDQADANSVAAFAPRVFSVVVLTVIIGVLWFAAAGRVPRQERAEAVDLRVNINTASAAELELLPGVGPQLAARIVEHRTEHGAMNGPADLDKVRGIGPKSMEALLPLVRFR